MTSTEPNCNDYGGYEAENEHTPLIQRDDGCGGSVHPVDPRHASSQPVAFRRLGIILACIGLVLLIELGSYLALLPLNQVLEEIICHDAFPNLQLEPNDPRCKDKSVQTELSTIRGWQSSLEFVPGLLVAVPYGFAADKIGRERVLSLSLLGLTLTAAFYIFVCSLPSVFPPRFTWFSSIFTFIGGGAAVFNAMILAIIGDVVSEEQRSTMFFYITAAGIGGELVASPLVYFLMDIHVWLPIYTGLGCLTVATLVAFCFPRSPLPTDQTAAESTDSPKTWSSRFHATIVQIKLLRDAVLWFAWGDRAISALLLTFLVTTLGRFAHEILLQYVTKRYWWTWSQASLLVFVRSFFVLALLAAILPSVSYLLVHKWSYSAQGKDLFLARASAILLTIGALAVGLAGTPVSMIIGLAVFSLGSGYTLLVRSLLAAIVKTQQVGVLYTTMSMLETTGSLIAGPLLAFSFRKGMDWGGGWIGMPYIVAGCLFASALVTICSISLSRLEPKIVDGESEE